MAVLAKIRTHRPDVGKSCRILGCYCHDQDGPKRRRTMSSFEATSTFDQKRRRIQEWNAEDRFNEELAEGAHVFGGLKEGS